MQTADGRFAVLWDLMKEGCRGSKVPARELIDELMGRREPVYLMLMAATQRTRKMAMRIKAS